MRLAASVNRALSTIDCGSNGDLSHHHLLLILTHGSGDFLFSQVRKPGAILPTLVYWDMFKNAQAMGIFRPQRLMAHVFLSYPHRES